MLSLIHIDTDFVCSLAEVSLLGMGLNLNLTTYNSVAPKNRLHACSAVNGSRNMPS